MARLSRMRQPRTTAIRMSWMTRLLARHARERGPAAGHECLAHLAQGTACKILGKEEIKPHKACYHLEDRHAEFAWIRATATRASDLPPERGVHATFARDHEYRRHGTLSPLAGIPSPQPRVRAIPQASRCRLSDRYRNQADFRQSFGADIERNQSLTDWTLTFPPSMARGSTSLRAFSPSSADRSYDTRVTSKHELKERIMTGIADVTDTWSYRLAEAA